MSAHNNSKPFPPLSTLCFQFQAHICIWLTQHLNMISALKSTLPPTLAWHCGSCESIMRQLALHRCKNMRSCQWIHKSSGVHMDTLCDQMFQPFLILLTLYCSAHLLICPTHYDEHTHTRTKFYALWALGVQRGQWVFSLQGDGWRRLWFV